jgi:hypothetical protein
LVAGGPGAGAVEGLSAAPLDGGTTASRAAALALSDPLPVA